jgi:hypothetical protein
MSVVLSSAMPRGVHNGLESLAEVLTGYPTQSHIVVAVVSCKQVTTQSKSGKVVATAGILDIEAFASGTQDWETLGGMLRSRREDRTGQFLLVNDPE